MLFSGPLQPALLGAALGSANLHLRPEFVHLQAGLGSRIELVNRTAESHGVRLSSVDSSPIFFVRCGPATAAYAVAHALRRAGLYTCIGVFPAVPLNHAGIRFTLSLHNSFEDIEHLLAVLGTEMRRLEA